MLWLIAVMFATSLWLLAERVANVPHDAREPPLIPQPVSFVGHLLRILQDGSRYCSNIRRAPIDSKPTNQMDLTRTSARFSLPLYTLRVPRSKIYIVSSPDIVAAVDRNSRNASFAPYVVEFAKRILAPSKEGLDALAANLNEENGAWGCRSETLKVMHATLTPGDDLDRTTQAFCDSLSSFLESNGSEKGAPGLFSWVRKLTTRASTDAIYGTTRNPSKIPQSRPVSGE